MTPENKTVSVYIPDELRKQAEEAGINLSATLRDALETELARRKAIADTLSDGVEEHEVELEEVTGVITGRFLAELRDGDQVFLTNDERVLVYDVDRLRVDELGDPETELAEWLQNDPHDAEALAGVMRQLGMRPRVRL